MFKNLCLLALVSISCFNFSRAQNEIDALRYTQTDLFGSARFESMAGSFGALGADFSAIQINPGGMGRFSSSQFLFSVNNNAINTTGVYNDLSSDVSDNSFKPNAIAVVFTNDASGENKGKVFRQFSLGYTRSTNFDQTKYYEGQNFNSLLDVFANDGAGILEENGDIYDLRRFSTAMGLDTETIFYDPDGVSYYSNLTNGDMYHERTITSTGGIGEFHIGLSENYMNQLYYGGSIGIRRINYEERIRHTETLLEPEGVSLESFDYMFNLATKGWGYNLKLGLIYLPKEELRLGFSFESPSIINLTDEYNANMIGYHDFGTVPVPDEFIPRGEFGYRLKTPMKIRGSLAYIFDNRGAINFDVEFVNYPGARLSAAPSGLYGSYDFQFENMEIRNQYRPVLNLRVGGEYKLSNEFFLRGGFALLPQPFTREIENLSGINKTFAVGVGWERKNIMIDLSYRAVNMNTDYFAFDPSQESNRTLFTTWSNVITVSTSFRF